MPLGHLAQLPAPLCCGQGIALQPYPWGHNGRSWSSGWGSRGHAHAYSVLHYVASPSWLPLQPEERERVQQRKHSDGQQQRRHNDGAQKEERSSGQ